MDHECAVRLTRDEVLVLAEWLQRQEDIGDYEGLVQHPGERQALYNLHAALEPLLLAPGDYATAASAARDRLVPED